MSNQNENQTQNAKRSYDRTSYVLIVDDDDTLLKFFKIHLNKFFSRVIVVRNAKEAIETIRAKEIDLVITDIRMPRTDGFQLLKKVRNFDASIPVVLISAYLTEEQMKEANEYADGYLKKPFSVDELHQIIDDGFKKREILKEFAPMFDDNKTLLRVLTGKGTVERLAKSETKTEAVELFQRIRKAS